MKGVYVHRIIHSSSHFLTLHYLTETYSLADDEIISDKNYFFLKKREKKKETHTMEKERTD